MLAVIALLVAVDAIGGDGVVVVAVVQTGLGLLAHS